MVIFKLFLGEQAKPFSYFYQDHVVVNWFSKSKDCQEDSLCHYESYKSVIEDKNVQTSLEKQMCILLSANFMIF
jgi:hypothetical protein